MCHLYQVINSSRRGLCPIHFSVSIILLTQALQKQCLLNRILSSRFTTSHTSKMLTWKILITTIFWSYFSMGNADGTWLSLLELLPWPYNLSSNLGHFNHTRMSGMNWEVQLPYPVWMPLKFKSFAKQMCVAGRHIMLTPYDCWPQLCGLFEDKTQLVHFIHLGYYLNLPFTLAKPKAHLSPHVFHIRLADFLKQMKKVQESGSH